MMAGQVVGDLNDPDYINWYKANRALHCTIDVLRPVCLAEIQTFHNSLLLKHGRGTCSKPCSHSDIITHGKWGSWSIPCPNKVCSKWLSDIVRGKSTKSTRLNWQNSEFSQWQTTPWQLAKVYMDHGQDRSDVVPADTDATGIVQLLINFKPFSNTMDTRKVNAVRIVRNELMHNTNMKVSSADLSRYIKTMITLLQDPIKLLQDTASQHAVTEITQIETDVIEVNDQAFLKQERTIWKTHIAGQADDNKQELLKVINANKSLESRLQSLDEKTGEVREEVKDVAKRLDEKTDEVREEVKDVAKRLDEKTSEVREEVKDATKRLDEKTDEVREEVKDVAKRLDEKTYEVREEVKDVAKRLDEKTDEVREEVKDLGKKTDEVRDAVKDVTKRLDEKTGEVDELKAQMQIQHRQNARDIAQLQGGHQGQGEVTCHQQVIEKVKTALRMEYSDYTVPVQWSVDADSCMDSSLDDMFVELRLQQSRTTKLPETLGYRDVVEMQKIMQSVDPIQVSQLFDKLHDRHAPRNVLILGKAGIGKTTLVKQLAKRWAEKKLWNDDVEYLFVITLRELRQERNLTLGDILLGGLGLTEEEKSEALKQLRKNSRRTMVVLEAMDEASYFKYEKKLQRDCTMEVDLNTLLSGIIGNTMLPGAKVIITSRPNDNIPTAMCHRTAELYGFTQENIKEYIHKFCGEDTLVEKFITGHLQNNVNIATLCYVPVHANFVCACLANMYSPTHSEDTPSIINTMSQLYVYAVINLARHLHPFLKDVKEQIDSEMMFAKVGNSFKKHADLAKHCTMSKPLRIIIYKDDLEAYDISDTDKHTGFLAESATRDLIGSGFKRRCWTFHHLTMQEMFAGIGLLRGPPEDLLELIDDETSVRKHEVLITFIAGLLCDPQNAHFMMCLEPARDQLEPRTFIKKLAYVLDTWKLATYIYESQRSQLVDLIPEEITLSSLFPTEMLSLCWIMKQPQCGVIKLELKHSHLDSHLFKQLCDGLEQNRSIKELSLINNTGLLQTVEVAEVLGRALTAMTHLRVLELNKCDLSPGSLTPIMSGLTRGGNQLEVLNLGGNTGSLNTVEAAEVLGRALTATTRLRVLGLWACDLSLASMTAILAGLTRGPGSHQLEVLDLSFNTATGSLETVEAGRQLSDTLGTMTRLRELELWDCGLTDQSLTALSTGLTRHGGQQLQRLECGFNPALTDDSGDTFRRLLTQHPELTIRVVDCHLSPECVCQLEEEFGRRWFYRG